MAFCARYDSRSQYLFDIDELIIPFHGTSEKISDFLEAHSKQRVIIDIKEEWRPFFKAIFIPIGQQYTNLALRLSKLDMDIVADLQATHIDYFLNKVVVDWESFAELVDLGVSDIYIGEQLGFELKDVATAAAKYKIRTRVYPNIAQAARKSTDSLKSFFVRPEDVDLYNERYISTFEFYMPQEKDINWDVLYRAYAINKRWTGPLHEIILGLDSDINNMYMSPRWGEFRMNCRRDCLKGKACKMCSKIYNLSKTLKELGVMPTPTKDSKQAAKNIMKIIDAKHIQTDPPLPKPKTPNF